MFKKRLFSVLVCLVVICSSVVVVCAAPVAKLTEDINSVKRGETVNFVISVSDTDATKSVGALVKYDESVFEFVSGEILVSGAVLSDLVMVQLLLLFHHRLMSTAILLRLN